MELQTLDEVEKSLIGRPPSPNKKCRMSFYLNANDATNIKAYAIENETTVSTIVRGLLKPLVNEP
jgi:hypothetical protein